jgi:hypothetical protein
MKIKTKFKNIIIKLHNYSFVKGIIKGISIPALALPEKIQTFYSHPFVRLFRVIGAISFLLVISKLYLKLPDDLHFFLVVIASIQVTQVILIFLIKLFYTIYTLIFNKDKFEVRNSPLDRYASMIAKVLYCAKFGCITTGLGASLIAGGVSYDTLLVCWLRCVASRV